MPKSVRHLYQQFHPERYNLHLLPKRETSSFSGTIQIIGKKVGRPAKRIVFHQHGLIVTNARVYHTGKKGETEYILTRIYCHRGLDELRIHSGQIFYPGTYRVELTFDAPLTDTMHGMYQSYFTYENTRKSIIVTQFESHHAREVFPCIDEPEAKAVYNLTLTHDKRDVALANTPIKTQTNIGDVIVTVFEESPKMSSYLLAFALGELHCVQAETKSGIIVKSWSSLVQPLSHLEYSVKEAAKVLDFFEAYYGYPYPLKKCDQLALPDFDSGAMENWGLITYREIALLADPDNRSLSGEQYVTQVVAHELSHQWFGNLVTMKWWDNLWLNESFASLMEHVAMDSLYPNWQQWEQYAATDIISASNRDVYSDVQPVQVAVSDPEQISTIFDPAIVYAKGGRLLKMLMEYIGEADFKKGLTRYFSKHAYGTTTEKDLWEAFESVSDKELKTIMNTWISQSGMPVLDVTYANDKLSLHQERFIMDQETSPLLWPIPLLSNYASVPSVLDNVAQQYRVVRNENTLLINQSGSGHYVVNYRDTAHLEEIHSDVSCLRISSDARITILNDTLLLCIAGKVSFTSALQILLSSQNEPREAVWALYGRILSYAKLLIQGDESADKQIKKLCVMLSKKHYNRLGWTQPNDEDPNDTLLRQVIISWMLAGEDKGTTSIAHTMYDSVQDITQLPADLRTSILASEIRNSGLPMVKTLSDTYKNSENAELQLNLCGAITSTKDNESLEYIIHNAFGENGFVRDQDIRRWFAYLMRNHYTQADTWNWATNNWGWIKKRLGKTMSYSDLPTYLAGTLNTSDWLERYEAFFTPLKKETTLERNICIAISEIKTRVAWRQRDEAGVKSWLDEHC